MRYVIFDGGAVGALAAQRLGELGHETTVVEHVDDLPTRAKGVDGILVASIPRLRFSPPRRQRAVELRRDLLNVVQAAAIVHSRVVLLSSIVVYGDGGPGDGPLTESSPLTIDLEPAAQCYGAAERMVLESRYGMVLRLADVVGYPGDLSEGEHGELHLSGEALWHRIDYRDAAAVAAFAIDQDLVGVYLAVPDSGAAPSFARALPGASFIGDLRTPSRPISSARLRAEGFSFGYAPSGA